MRGWNSDNFSDNYVVRASCLLSLNLDIVGVVETHLKNDETLEVAGYEWFGQNRKRLHVNARCRSGGVGILIKNALLREFECKVVDNSYEGTLWLRLKHKFNRTCLILCVCYLPPENSSRQADVFGFYVNLLTGIYEFQDMGPVCLFGDFNSRCADLNDYIKGVDNLSDREVVDFQVNKYGHILLDFLMNSNFCILNGRNSIKNDFTSVSTKGSSVVDYCFVSHSDFYVYTASELINLSGHKEAVIPVPEMSTKKVIFRMENCGHLPVEVCGVLGRFVRKSTQAGNFFCADIHNISICRSAVVRREVRGSLRTSMRTSADVYADVRMDWCGRPHGWVRMSAEVRMDGCGHPQGQRIS